MLRSRKMYIHPDGLQQFDKNDLFYCNKYVADWLVYTEQIPLLSQAGNKYYFMRTLQLEESLNHIPCFVKILAILP